MWTRVIKPRTNRSERKRVTVRCGRGEAADAFLTSSPRAPCQRGLTEGPRQKAKQGKAWGSASGRGEAWAGGGAGRTHRGRACVTCGPSGADAGPTWGGVCTHSVHRAVQRRQPALHAADALGEAGLLSLQHLLQLADGREELLLVQTVLRGERITSATAVGASAPHARSQLPEATQAPGPPMPPQLTERLHKAPLQLALSQVTRRRAPSAQNTAPAHFPTKTKLLL